MTLGGRIQCGILPCESGTGRHSYRLSGVTDITCKSLVKQRLPASNMRWKTNGAQILLSLRALINTVRS